MKKFIERLKNDELFDLRLQIKYCILMKNEDSLYSIRNCIFGFQCKHNWNEMAQASDSTSDNEVRFCSGCEKEVYQCLTDEDLTHNIQLNRCVAITRSSDNGEEMLLGFMTCAPPKLTNDD